MADIKARTWNQQQFGYVPHTSVTGETWNLVFKGFTTGAGAAAGTTIVDANHGSGGADTYNGRYWVRITSGALLDKWKRVIDDDGAGALTLENNGFEAQVAAAVSYELWLSPEPVVVVDSSAAETNMVDAVRTEADVNLDPYWKDYYAVPITGTHRGKKAKITNFVPGSGTFTLEAAFGGVLAAGDVVLLRRFVEVSGIAAGVAQEYIPRPSQRVNCSLGDGVIGARSGTFNFNTQICQGGVGATRPSKSPISGLFQAAGLEEIVGTTCTIQAGSTTTSINIATGTWENIVQAGVMVIINNEPRFVTAITDGAGADDVLTVSPPLTTAPGAADLVYGTRSYVKSTDADSHGVCIEWEVDGIRHTITGCKGNVTLASSAVPELQWAFSVDHWIREVEAAPYNAATAYSAEYPVLESDRQCWVNTTATNIGGFTATIGSEIARLKVQGSDGINGGSGYQFVKLVGGGTFREVLTSTGDTLPQDLKYGVRTAFGLIVVYGAAGKTFAHRSPVARIIQLPNPEDDEGIAAVPTVYQSQDAGVLADGAGVLKKIPDFGFFLT